MREVAAISPAYAILLLGEGISILQLNCLFSLMTYSGGNEVGALNLPGLSICHVKLPQSTTTERVDLRSLSPALRNLWLLLVKICYLVLFTATNYR